MQGKHTILIKTKLVVLTDTRSILKDLLYFPTYSFCSHRQVRMWEAFSPFKKRRKKKLFFYVHQISNFLIVIILEEEGNEMI